MYEAMLYATLIAALPLSVALPFLPLLRQLLVFAGYAAVALRVITTSPVEDENGDLTVLILVLPVVFAVGYAVTTLVLSNMSAGTGAVRLARGGVAVLGLGLVCIYLAGYFI